MNILAQVLKYKWDHCLGPSLVLLAPGPLLRQLSSLILEMPQGSAY